LSGSETITLAADGVMGFATLNPSYVMPALVAGIHDLLGSFTKQDVDGRDKPGHDDAASHHVA
jgi:hypothetical protein